MRKSASRRGGMAEQAKSEGSGQSDERNKWKTIGRKSRADMDVALIYFIGKTAYGVLLN